MIIPSIDIMDGQAVQLRQGKEHVLTSDQDPISLAKLFNRYGEVAVIDLDAALGKGDNLELICQICQVADVRVGGGIRDKERARRILRAGAKRIIIGTSAEPDFLKQFSKAQIMVALDHKGGTVVDKGWTGETQETVLERAERLAPYCGSFLCTNVNDEGTMSGVNLDDLKALQKQIDLPLTVAGGIANTEEVVAVSQLGLDVQVGMALYKGDIDPVNAVVNSVDFDKAPLVPTVVKDEAGQFLMLAYSNPESLKLALEEGKGIYYSRSRKEIWRKGETSGNTQTLLSCRVDCDRDTLLFTVKQNGPACHTNAYSCFGSGLQAADFSLPALFNVLQERKTNPPEGSYSAKLFQNRELLFRKLMEEAFEVTTAKSKNEFIWEIADTLYFLSVIAVDEGINWQDIEAELGGRQR